MALAVLAARLVSGRHSSQGEAKSAIEPTLRSPVPSKILVRNAPKILSTTKWSDRISDTQDRNARSSPKVVLAPGREFFVASSAVGVLSLSRLSRSAVRLSFWDLGITAVYLV